MKTEVLDHGYIRLVDHMGSDLSVVRSARVSYDADWRSGENEGSDAKLIRYLMKNRHSTPFESVTMTFEVQAPIFVFRQWHRHRTACLSGDAKISFELPCRNAKGVKGAKTLTLSELYRKWQPTVRSGRPERQQNALRPRQRIQNMLLRTYDEKTKEFTTGTIDYIVFSGNKQVFEVVTENGKRLKCSKDHRILTNDGWMSLEKAVGLTLWPTEVVTCDRECFVLTNGVPAYQSSDWLLTKKNALCSVSDMAEAAGCSYHTIRKWLKIHGLMFTPLEIAKLKPVWNKGITGYTVNRVFTDEDRDRTRKARSGDKSNWWKGGVTSERARIGRWTTVNANKVHELNDNKCTECGSSDDLHAHHVKSVREFPDLAYEIGNLTTLCGRCHRQEHIARGDMSLSPSRPLSAKLSRILSVTYLGEEPTYDIVVKGPNHNFVADGIVVHNSYNEVSARYAELPELFYVPRVEDIGVQSKSNKQARDLDTPMSPDEFDALTEDVNYARFECRTAFAMYRSRIAAGWPRELARAYLPFATYSRMFVTLNLWNAFHFLTLRTHEHSQHEIRVYADAMVPMIESIVPVSVGAWRASEERWKKFVEWEKTGGV